MLLRFSKTNVLDDTSSATEDEARRNIVKLMNPKEDEKAKDRIFIKINQAFNRIKNGPFSNRDKKVISCIINKEASDDSEYDVDSSEEHREDSYSLRVNTGVISDKIQKHKNIFIQQIKSNKTIRSPTKRFRSKSSQDFSSRNSSESSSGSSLQT